MMPTLISVFSLYIQLYNFTHFGIIKKIISIDNKQFSIEIK